MWWSIHHLFVLVLFCFVNFIASGSNHKYVPRLIQSNGYKCEVHRVVTFDGYILELHRIPQGKNGFIHKGKNEFNSHERKPVVLLSHCIFCSSASFVVLGPKKALAYKLANNGYDVWMLNARGTSSSQRHVFLSPTSKKFWQFGWHEMGLYDLSATIDYILKLTQEDQLDYVGFSMGTTEFFVLMSERPEYNKKIRQMVAMSASAFLNSSASFFPIQQPLSNWLVEYSAKTGKLEFPYRALNVNDIFSTICHPSNRNFLGGVCNKVLHMFGENNNGNINPKSLPFFFSYFPDRTSIRSVIHYSQLRDNGLFTKYNYGWSKNLEIYGNSEPPQYNLSKITASVNVLWSRGDLITEKQGIARIVEALPNVSFVYEIPFQSFSHFDFVWGNNANSLVYDVILKILHKGRQ